MTKSRKRRVPHNSAAGTSAASGGGDGDQDFQRRSVLRRRPSVAGLFDDSSFQSDIPGPESAQDSATSKVKAKGKGKAVEKENKDGDEKANVKREKKKSGASELKFSYRASFPVHCNVRESPLSSDSIFRQSHAGLLNLCIVVLVAVNGRLIIENILKYGWLMKSDFWFSTKSLRDWPLLMCCCAPSLCSITLAIFPVASYLVEILAQQERISEPAIISLHIFITTSAVVYPVLVILRCNSAFLSGVTLMLLTCIIGLKLVSYGHTNSDLRSLKKLVEKGEEPPDYLKSEYSYTVSFKSMVYFMVAPTLCYQPRYPRTPAIRKQWVVRQLVKLIISTGFMGFIIEQYITPIVQNSEHPLKGNLLFSIERVLRLSVPNLYLWLCMFYSLFHLWLNILAELLRFGDREFYRAWWNAQTVEDYWKLWNMPVHKWMVRHLYFPCLRKGLPKSIAVVVTFFVSAVLHELCVAVPGHMFRLWAFLGIMFQLPLIVITNYLRNKYESSMVGNMIFWFTFCVLGQPMCILLYYHDIVRRNNGVN